MRTRKTLAILAMLILMFSVLPLNISKAVDGPKFTVTSKEAEKGENVTVVVNLDKDIEGVTALTIKLAYDTTALEVVGKEVGETLNSISADNAQVGNQNGVITFVTGTANAKTCKAGVVGTVTFKVKEGATKGATNLALTIDEIADDNAQDIKDTIGATKQDGTINVVIPVTGVTISGPANATSSTLNVNETSGAETAQLTATVAPADADQDVTWSSSNTAVATVSNSGLVTAVRPGTAVITATKGTQSASYNITVKAELESI